MPSPGMRGWYVELDEELVKKFDELFPEHGSKAELTTAAVVWAVRMRATGISAVMAANELSFGKKTFTVHLAPGGDDVSRDAGGKESADGGTKTTDDDVSRTGDQG